MSQNFLIGLIVAGMVFVTGGFFMGCEAEKADSTEAVTELKVEDVEMGTGTEAKTGDRVQVHYTGWLYPNGKKFDSSVDRGQPFGFPLGGGRVIQGWDEGVVGMKEGGKRILIIPPDKAYGDQEVGGGLIPANSTLKFEVELIKVQ